MSPKKMEAQLNPIWNLWRCVFSMDFHIPVNFQQFPLPASPCGESSAARSSAWFWSTGEAWCSTRKNPMERRQFYTYNIYIWCNPSQVYRYFNGLTELDCKMLWRSLYYVAELGGKWLECIMLQGFHVRSSEAARIGLDTWNIPLNWHVNNQ